MSAFRMVSANVFRVPIKADSGRSRERHERTTRINYFDVDYGEPVPDGASQAQC